MNYLTVTSAPIQQAIDILQKRTSRNGLLFIGAASFLTCYNLISCIKAKRQKYNLPPKVPFSLPFFRHALYVMTFSNQFIDYCNQKYGELYRLNMFGKDVTIASEKFAEETLKAEHEDLSLGHGILKGVLHPHYCFDKLKLHDIRMYANPIVAKVVVANSKMQLYVPDVQKGIDLAIDTYFKKNVLTTFNSPSKFFQILVAYMSVPTLIEY